MWPGMTKGPLWLRSRLPQQLSPSRGSGHLLPETVKEMRGRTFRKHLEKALVALVSTKGSSKATVSVTSQRFLIKGKLPLSHWESRAQPWFWWSGSSRTGSGANRACRGAA